MGGRWACFGNCRGSGGGGEPFSHNIKATVGQPVTKQDANCHVCKDGDGVGFCGCEL